MRLTLMNDQQEELKPRITVFGVGGAGGNAVNNMIEQQLEGVEFVVANTDAQALQQSNAPSKIQMGMKVTEGLGAGARPSVGAAAAEETIEEIVDHLAGAHMCFITAGMVGGTGTGAAPIIAQAARELGVLTVGVVTKPFQFEGNKRMRQANEGIEALQKVVDTLIIIPNQNLFRLANDRTTFTEAFAMADDVLYQGVKGVTDLMVRPGLINLDFADVRAVMDEMGKAMMGTGEAEGEDRAKLSAEKAIANPLLDEISLNGAKGVLINITGGYDLTLFELDEAAEAIRTKVDPDANIIVGSTLDTTMEGRLRVSVVATGIEARVQDEPTPTRRPLAQPLTQAAPQVEERATPTPPPIAQRPAPQPPVHRAMFEQPQEDVAQEPDDLPPPAYRTQPAAAQPQAAAPAPQPRVQRAMPQVSDDASSFVAPRGRAPSGQPGSPSPETMARLAAAVSKAPPRGSAVSQQRPAAPAQQAPRQAAPAEQRPRFGIGSLINRMAGHAEQPEPRPQPQPQRNQQQVAYEEDQEQSPEQERIEIPAFLRRQAN